MKRENKIESTVNDLDSDGIMGRNKDCLLGKPVDYDQDSVKSKG